MDLRNMDDDGPGVPLFDRPRSMTATIDARASSDSELDALQAMLEQKRQDAGIVIDDDPVSRSKWARFQQMTEAAQERAARNRPDPEEERRWAEEDERRRRQEERWAKEQAWSRLIGEVGRRYREATLDSFEVTCPKQQSVVDAMKAYASNIVEEIQSGAGVVLFGPSGTGKDHLLLGLAREAIRAGVKRIEHVNAADLFGQFRDAMDNEKTSEARLVREYLDPDVLILSDPVPLQGSLTDFQCSTLFRILDGRYRACKPVWVTMNVAAGAEAEARLGVAIVDRMRDGALCLYCDWPSYRKPRTIAKETQ